MRKGQKTSGTGLNGLRRTEQGGINLIVCFGVQDTSGGGEFVSQDLQVGTLHFNVIDFGENILLNTATQKLIGAAERREKEINVRFYI